MEEGSAHVVEGPPWIVGLALAQRTILVTAHERYWLTFVVGAAEALQARIRQTSSASTLLIPVSRGSQGQRQEEVFLPMALDLLLNIQLMNPEPVSHL